MCGRYTQTSGDPADIANRFGFDDRRIDPSTLNRFNVCPTESILVVTGDGHGTREGLTVRWGLVPPRAEALGKGSQPINARSESALKRGLFRGLMERADRRCLVVADGWYEWLRSERPKEPRIPFHYKVDGGELFAFAGLWRRTWVAGEEVLSAAILTTTANEVCAPVHDRMPCVVPDREAEAAWLSAEVDGEAALEFLLPLVSQRVTVAPANPAVNKAGVEGAELLVAPKDAAPAQLGFDTL
jgi:putative SOS response-associated peptidase YedK